MVARRRLLFHPGSRRFLRRGAQALSNTTLEPIPNLAHNDMVHGGKLLWRFAVHLEPFVPHRSDRLRAGPPGPGQVLSPHQADFIPGHSLV